MKFCSNFIYAVVVSAILLINVIVNPFVVNLSNIIRKEKRVELLTWKKILNDCKSDSSNLCANIENLSPSVISSLDNFLLEKASKRRFLDFRYQLKVDNIRKEIMLLVRKNIAIQTYVKHRLSSLTQRAIFDEFFQKIFVCFHDPTNSISSAAHLLGEIQLMSFNTPNPRMKKIYDILLYNNAFRLVVWKEFKFDESMLFPYLEGVEDYGNSDSYWDGRSGVDVVLSGYLSDSPDPLLTTVYLASGNNDEIITFFNTLSQFLNRPPVEVFDHELAVEGEKIVGNL